MTKNFPKYSIKTETISVNYTVTDDLDGLFEKIKEKLALRGGKPIKLVMLGAKKNKATFLASALYETSE